MKKKLFALLIAGVMAMSVNAFAAETELTEEMTTESAADTSTVVLQGLDDNGITWTLALNAENAMGCVALTPEGDETTYITGALAFGDGTFTVGEDRQTVTFTTTEGAEVSFTVVDVEGVDNQIDVTLNDTVIRLSLVDMNTLK